MANKITITDIANLAGVTKATVSYYLNGKTNKMSEKTALKIKNAIYKQTEEIIMDYDKGRMIKMIKTQRPISNEEVEVEITKEYQSIKGY